MADILYWPTTLPQAPTFDFQGGPVDYRQVFEPDQGGPITRPKGTGAISRWTAPFVLSVAQLATFETWHAETLGQGSSRFIWRTQPQGEVRWWKFAKADQAYSIQYLSNLYARVSMQLVQYPHTPWFADYVLADSSRSPAWVADYANTVYGIGKDKVSASDLPTIDGTYLVYRTVSGTTTSGPETLTAGDIPATAPLNTTLIVGYDPL